MATPTPTPKASSASSASSEPKPAAQVIVDKDDPDAPDPTLVTATPSHELQSSYKFDPSVQHTADGGGTKQRELKPEDYPPSLRMAPPAEQVNPNSKTSVGTPVPGLIAGEADKAILEGIEQHNDIVREAQAKIDDENTDRNKAA